jgi:small subunit ribosomal protein S8
MALSDPIGDMLTRIRNAQLRRRDNCTTPASTLRGRVLDVLKSEGFIRGYTESKADNGVAEFQIELKYSENIPVIRTIERVSRPGRRVGVSILSTPKGVMADHEAKSQNLGGEVLCRVF